MIASNTNDNELILDENSFLVLETDANGVITSANSDFCAFSGYDIDELLDSSYSILKYSDMPPYVLEGIKRSIQTKSLWKGVIKHHTKNYEKFYWAFSIIVPIKSKVQEHFLYIGVKPTGDEINATQAQH